MRFNHLLATATLLTSSALVSAQSPSPSTPYEFSQGFPAPSAARQARDDADFQRAVTAYRFWYPTVSCEGVFAGNRAQGIQDNQAIPILSAGPRQVIFTANSDTPYGGACLDVADGPMVVELPPGPFIAVADDHHQRWIADMGLPGPDAGKGGKHLIVGPKYDGTPPPGYHVSRSDSNKVFLAIRALPTNGDVRAAMDALRSIKVYPLSTASDPKTLQYVDVTDRKADMTCLTWEDNLQYWQRLHDVLDAEPLVDEYRPMYGLLAPLGIEKGKPFAPDAHMKAILERAARAGRDQLLVSAFDGTRPDRITWKDRKWEWASLVPDDGNFETPAGTDLQARDRWFAQAILASPAMFRRSPGAGSLYWLGLRDSTGAYLDGGKSYKLTVPLPVPAKLFWSVTAYDAATRSEVQTAQNKAALRSLFELKDTTGPQLAASTNAVDLYFGPTAPPGHESRWIQTTPGRGWFTYFRIYGPEGPTFDGTWKPGDFEELK